MHTRLRWWFLAKYRLVRSLQNQQWPKGNRQLLCQCYQDSQSMSKTYPCWSWYRKWACSTNSTFPTQQCKRFVCWWEQFHVWKKYVKPKDWKLVGHFTQAKRTVLDESIRTNQRWGFILRKLPWQKPHPVLLLEYHTGKKPFFRQSIFMFWIFNILLHANSPLDIFMGPAWEFAGVVRMLLVHILIVNVTFKIKWTN